MYQRCTRNPAGGQSPVLATDRFSAVKSPCYDRVRRLHTSSNGAGLVLLQKTQNMTMRVASEGFLNVRSCTAKVRFECSTWC